jgi:hypothetical protein
MFSPAPNLAPKNFGAFKKNLEFLFEGQNSQNKIVFFLVIKFKGDTNQRYLLKQKYNFSCLFYTK